MKQVSSEATITVRRYQETATIFPLILLCSVCHLKSIMYLQN
jgi:hypothetical protein